ncbi:hypothetical protein WG68_06200 [Arsukibacterium ikkense]|uniref:Zinc resistance-associated protein n=2 Tax=Arsukibacterium ikkense TaxID=336831 RepID=A0A0M2V9N1_9GAMM|nr:hypothetical protein WG68_06200 [Arsukibacterium ikkense]
MLTAACLMLLSSNAIAGHHSKPERAGKSYQMQGAGYISQKMLAGIELSSEQQRQLQQLIAEHRAEQPKRQRANAERGALRQMLQADYFDETAVTELVQRQQQQQLAQRVAQLKLRHQVYQLLTSEQREQMVNQQQHHKQKWQLKRQATPS